MVGSNLNHFWGELRHLAQWCSWSRPCGTVHAHSVTQLRNDQLLLRWDKKAMTNYWQSNNDKLLTNKDNKNNQCNSVISCHWTNTNTTHHYSNSRWGQPRHVMVDGLMDWWFPVQRLCLKHDGNPCYFNKILGLLMGTLSKLHETSTYFWRHDGLL